VPFLRFRVIGGCIPPPHMHTLHIFTKYNLEILRWPVVAAETSKRLIWLKIEGLCAHSSQKPLRKSILIAFRMKVRLVISSIKEEKKNYLSRNLFNYLNPLYLHGKIFPWGMGLSIKGALDFPALFKNDLKLN